MRSLNERSDNVVSRRRYARGERNLVGEKLGIIFAGVRDPVVVALHEIGEKPQANAAVNLPGSFRQGSSDSQAGGRYPDRILSHFLDNLPLRERRLSVEQVLRLVVRHRIQV